MNNHDVKGLFIKELVVGYAGIPILKNIDLQIDSGDIVGIIGRNGSGKSTLIRTIAGLQKPISGHMICEGKDFTDIPAGKRAKQCKMGCLLQHNRNIPSLTVRENLHLAQWDISSWAERDRNIDNILTQEPFNKLRDHLDKYADFLSGGQDLLLAIAGLLLQKNKIILLDEPSDGLDEENRQMILTLIRDLQQQGKILIMVEQILRVLFLSATRAFVIRDTAAVSSELHQLKEGSFKEIYNIFWNNPILQPGHNRRIDSLIWEDIRN